MNAPSHSVRMPRPEAKAGGGFLYGWLLFALFIEYARPTNQLTWLAFPYFYSLVPLTLLLVSSFSQNLRPMKKVMADPIAKWVYIMTAILGVSVIVAPVSSIAQAAFELVLGYAFLFTLIARIVTTEERLSGVIVTLALAHLYLIAMNPAILSNPEQRNVIEGATFLGDGNDFSLSLCILLPCMIGIALTTTSRIWKILLWSGAPIIMLAIVSTQSRGGTLGLGAVLVYLLMRSPRKAVSLLAIGAIGLLVLVYAPPAYFERMGTISSSSSSRDGSAQRRIDAWKGAIGMGVKNPVFGIGARHFGERWGMTAHSTYMLAFAELGFPGLICVLMLVVGNLRSNARMRGRVLARAGPRPSAEIKRTTRMLDMLNAGMVGFAVAGAFLSAAYYPHMYVLAALLISARILASRANGLTPSK